MKIKYEFANETVEIEVDELWGNVLVDLDRQDYNIDHKETRRHCSLEALDLDTSLEDICRVMGQTPSWAKRLLLRADGYVCDFYKKD